MKTITKFLFFVTFVAMTMTMSTANAQGNVTFETVYHQDFTGGPATWDGDTFYAQWETVIANMFTSADLTDASDGYLKFTWIEKRIMQSKTFYGEIPYTVEAMMMLPGGNYMGGMVIRVDALRIEDPQEPAKDVDGNKLSEYNKTGIAFYPGADNTSMVVQFTNTDYTANAQISVPTSFNFYNAKHTLKVEDYGDLINVTLNGDPFFSITLSNLTNGIYTDGEVKDADDVTLGTFAGMRVPATGRVAFAERTAPLRLYFVTIETEAATSADDNVFLKNDIKIYPNPAQDVLNFTTSGDNEITIRTIGGRTLKSVNNVTRMDISGLANGIYLVTIKENNNTSTKKLIVNR